jgi:hypothetical protein
MTDTAIPPAQPHAVATTTPPNGTFKELKIAPGDGALMYWPEQNGFIALFADEYREFFAEADEHSKKIKALQEANMKVSQVSVKLRAAHMRGVAAEIKQAEAELDAAIDEMQKASAEVKKKLEPLSKLDAKDGVKMVELVPLKKRQSADKPVPIYVKSTRLKEVLAQKRIHLLNSEDKKARDKDPVVKAWKINTGEIKKRIAEKTQDQGFAKKWKLKPSDADAYTGVLSEWARTMNGDIAKFLDRSKEDVEKKFNINPNDPHRNIDLSADAQLMRYTGGAGLEMNFKPFQGNLYDKRDKSNLQRFIRGVKAGGLGIKANAEASFAIAEGRIRTELYWPHFAGYHANAELAGQNFELGYWRFYGDIMLSGSVGASVAIEMDVGLSYVGGKQGVRGIPPAQRNKGAVKTRVAAGAEIDAFAGAKAGLDLNGALQWLNPEGAQSNGKPKKIKPGDAVAEFKDMAKVDAGVAGTAGIGVKGAFKFKHESGKFVIYARMGACLGLGGEGKLKFEAGTGTIGEFFKCMAYQLKRADYHKIADAIDDEVYKAFCWVQYLMIAQGDVAEKFVYITLGELSFRFRNVMKSIDDAVRGGTEEAEEYLRRIKTEIENQTGSWLSYAPPEVVGQIARQIAWASEGMNTKLSAQAPEMLALLLGAPQTLNHLETIAERMTTDLGGKQDKNVGFAMMTACVAGTQYGGCVGSAQQRIAAAQPMTSKPFIWNTEPEFIAAVLAIEHPMYS